MPFRTSYWEQTTFLRAADVVVIGAGLTGLQAALQLKKADPERDVLVVERAGIPRGASTRNAGFACFGGPTELLADLDAYGPESMADTVRQRLDGVNALKKNFAHRGIDWEQHGGYEVVDDPATGQIVNGRLAELNKALAPVTGLKQTWSVNPQNAHGPAAANAYHTPLEAQLHPGKLVQLLLNDARSAGIRFLFGCEVKHLGADAGAVKIETAGWGSIVAQKALVTVNAFARQLLPEDFPESIRPCRNQVLLSKPLPNLKLRGVYHYHEGYVYFRNVGPDRLLIGGARHLAGTVSETDAFGPNSVPEDYLLQKINEWFPQRTWTNADFPTRWSGIIAQGDSKSPVLRFADDNILVAARLAGMGVALSAALAERAANKMYAL